MNYQPYINRLKREKEKRRKLNEVRRLEGMAAARRTAAFLRESFRAKNVFLFGSCLHKEHFHQRSDVDLGVEDLASEDFLRALFEVNDRDRNFKIDLIDLGACDNFLRRKIFNEGMKL